MAFLAAAGTALLLETLGPVLAVVAVAWGLRARVEARVRAAGLAGVAAGAVLFLLVLLAKGMVVDRVPALKAAPDPDWLSRVSHGVVAGLFAAIAEETVRFAGAAWLFRPAKGSPLRAGALYGLGWGGVECLFVAARQLAAVRLALALHDGAGDVPMPFAPLLVPIERAGAMILHVALAGAAVAAVMRLARGRVRTCFALFAAAVVAHAALDAWVHVLFTAWGPRFDAGEPGGVAGILVMEAGFLAGSVAVLALVARRQGD